MTPDQISHVVWAVAWTVMAVLGTWISVGIGASAAGIRIISAAQGDFDNFGRESARSIGFVVIGWIVGAAWFIFAITKAIIHTVEVFV